MENKKTVTLKWQASHPPVTVTIGDDVQQGAAAKGKATERHLVHYVDLVAFATSHFNLSSCKLSVPAPGKNKSTLLVNLFKKPHTSVMVIGNAEKAIAIAVGNEESRIAIAEDAAEEEEDYELACRALLNRIHKEKWVPDSGVELREGLRRIAYDHATRAQHLAFVGEMDHLRLHMKGLKDARDQDTHFFTSRLVEAAIKGSVIQHGNEMAALAVVRFIIKQRATKKDVVLYISSRLTESAVTHEMVVTAAECGQIHILFYLLLVSNYSWNSKELWAAEEPKLVEQLTSLVQDPKKSLDIKNQPLHRQPFFLQAALRGLVAAGHLRHFKRTALFLDELDAGRTYTARDMLTDELRPLAIEHDRLRTYLWVCKKINQSEPPCGDLRLAVQHGSTHIVKYVCQAMASTKRFQKPLIQQALQEIIENAVLQAPLGATGKGKRILWTQLLPQLDITQLSGTTVHGWLTLVLDRGGRGYSNLQRQTVDAELLEFVIHVMHQQVALSFQSPASALVPAWTHQHNIYISIDESINHAMKHAVDANRTLTVCVENVNAAMASLLQAAGAAENAAGVISPASPASSRVDQKEVEAAADDGIVILSRSLSAAVVESKAETAKARLDRYKEREKNIKLANSILVRRQQEMDEAQRNYQTRIRMLSLLMTFGAQPSPGLLPEHLQVLHNSLWTRDLQDDTVIECAASVLHHTLKAEGYQLPAIICNMVLHYAYGYDETELPAHRLQLAEVAKRLPRPGVVASIPSPRNDSVSPKQH